MELKQIFSAIKHTGEFIIFILCLGLYYAFPVGEILIGNFEPYICLDSNGNIDQQVMEISRIWFIVQGSLGLVINSIIIFSWIIETRHYQVIILIFMNSMLFLTLIFITSLSMMRCKSDTVAIEVFFFIDLIYRITLSSLPTTNPVRYFEPINVV